MRNILFLTLGLLMVGCNHTTPKTDAVVRDTFVYAVKQGDTLRMDRYSYAPSERLGHQAPCMIFLFGGGFTSGSRDAEQYRSFFEYMAREKGYTVASIDYRLGLKQPSAAGQLSAESFPQLLPAAVMIAVEDFFDATKYIYDHAVEWQINPDRIVACGSSAGAITVLQGEYFIANTNPLTAHLPEGFNNYSGIISFAGAVVAMGGELTWTDAPAPMMLFHGDADSNVPYEALRLGGAGIFGSKYIAGQLAEKKLPYYFYSVENADHVVATLPMTTYRDAIDYFLVQMVDEKLPAMIETNERFTYNKPINKVFTIADFINSNYSGK